MNYKLDCKYIVELDYSEMKALEREILSLKGRITLPYIIEKILTNAKEVPLVRNNG